MRNERLRGYIDAIVLSVLLDGDSYGYEIAQEVNKRTQGDIVLKEGSLYPALKRMEANRLIQGYWGTDKDTGPRRRYYSIAAGGKNQLKILKSEWQREQQVLAEFFGKVVTE